ncbi:MAG: sporulation integral membrane protein YtvI [Lachnospirales bacterium]
MAYIRYLFMLLFVLICFILGVRYLLVLFIPFIVGYIISLCLNPIVVFFETKIKLSRGLSAGLSLIFFIFIIGAILTIIVQGISSQIKDLINNFDTISINLITTYKSMEQWLMETVNIFPDFLSQPIVDFFNNIVENLISFFSDYLKNSPTKLIDFGKKFFSITLIGTISSFFFMKDKELVRETLLKIIPTFVKDILIEIKKSSLKVIAGYFATQFKLMSVTFSISLVSLTLLDVGYSLIFALAISLVDILPFFGSGFFLWPMAIYYIFSKSYFTGIMLFVTYIVILFTRQFLEPRLLGEKLEVHPILMLMAMFAGLQILGFFGLLIGPLTLLIVKQLVTAQNKQT